MNCSRRIPLGLPSPTRPDAASDRPGGGSSSLELELYRRLLDGEAPATLIALALELVAGELPDAELWLFRDAPGDALAHVGPAASTRPFEPPAWLDDAHWREARSSALHFRDTRRLPQKRESTDDAPARTAWLRTLRGRARLLVLRRRAGGFEESERALLEEALEWVGRLRFGDQPSSNGLASGTDRSAQHAENDGADGEPPDGQHADGEPADDAADVNPSRRPPETTNGPGPPEARADGAAAAHASHDSLPERVLLATPTPLLLLDADGRVRMANPAAIALLGLGEGELLGSILERRLTRERDRERWRGWLQLCVRGEEGVRHEGDWRGPEGLGLHLEWIGQSIDAPGGGLVLATGREIGEWRTLERERDDLREALLHAQKMEDIGTLASGIAHDFNNHLTAIIGFTDLAAASVETGSPTHQSLQEVLRASRLAASVTRSLLTFTRKTATHKQSCDLVDIVGETMRLLQRVLPSSIRTDVQLGSPGHCTIWADATHVQQILMCLVINARDAMGDGGDLCVRVFAEEGDALGEPTAVIQVEDSGRGIDEDVRDRIFEPFFTTKRRGIGTGLGLPVMRSLVLEHGGRVHFDSTPGVGTRFSVRFPMRTHGPAQQMTPGEASERLVLIAEPDSFFRSILVSSLRQEGYEILEVGDEAACRKRMAGYKDSLDLVVLAQDLIDEPGSTLAADLLALRPSLHVVMIEGAREKGAGWPDGPRVLTLSKPFTVPELTETIADVLGAAGAPERDTR